LEITPNTLYCCKWQIKADARKARKIKQWVKESYFSYANYPLKILEIVGLEPSFPMIPGLSIKMLSHPPLPPQVPGFARVAHIF
jgi:hypothetical protein